MAASTETAHADTGLRVPTPSQTAGPFVSIGAEWDATGLLVPEGTAGAVSIVGHVFDGAGAPVTDAMLEFWQADPEGRFPSRSPAGPPSAGPPSAGPPSAGLTSAGPASVGSWTGFARALTDQEGMYRIVTVKPGPVPGPGGERQAPHIDVSIFARGLLQRLVTRIYFPDEEALNANDPVLSSLGDAALAQRLVASPEPGPPAPGTPSLRFDIRLQGEQETVFFAPW
jgi:protocatechuate 3,4-dioxygenase, alpha subunit